MNTVLTLVEILYVEFYDFADRVVKHEETGGFLDGMICLRYVYKIEDRRQNLVHALHVLYLRVQFGINVQNSGHIVIAVCLSLLFFARQKLLIRQFILAIYELEFLSSG
jgi:hypothetical protein